jgi:hydroxyacylglutathione hydrolase
MQITDRIYIVGSGLFGLGLSSRYDCHVYLIDGGTELALVDAGTGLGTAEIEANISAHGFDVSQLRKILLTHCHADHAGGAMYFRRAYGSVVCVPKGEAEALVKGNYGPTVEARHAGLYPPDYYVEPCYADVLLEEGSLVSCGSLSIQSILTPGHSPGSTCFFVKDTRCTALFSGDTASLGGFVGLFNDDGCDIRAYRKSIKRLASLQVDALLPGHGAFTVRFGQDHIDLAIDAFGRFVLPPHS